MKSLWFALALISALALEARAQSIEAPTVVEAHEEEDEEKIELEFTTYGSVNTIRSPYFENVQDTNPQKRWRTDLERVILEPEIEFYPNIKLEAEIEFEHGGTGATLEYEPEEAGEFEQEIEAGGEVIVEKLMLQIEQRPWINYRVGYIAVPVGMISQRPHPTEYFTTMRNRSEERILPSTWTEPGASLFGTVGEVVHYEVGVFNALNSEQFRTSSWIQRGQARLFEDSIANDQAVALRLDFGRYFKRWLVGASFYHGDSEGNRRKRGALAESAPVTIWDLHAFYESDLFSLRGLFLQGKLDNADLVTQANENALQGAMDPGIESQIGSEARAWFLEAGVNVQNLLRLPRRAVVFGRYDFVDSMYKTTGTVTRNPRFEEKGWTTGVNYFLRPEIVLKAQYGNFKTGDSALPTIQEISFGFGWYFSTEG